ncbi:hypothetical protein C6P44_002037, partial [Monosporozyma unispora]
MTKKLQKILTLSTLFLSLCQYSTAGIVPEACDMTGLTGKTGAKVRFYDYPKGDDTTYKDIAFLAGGYLNNTNLGTISNVQDLQWDSTIWDTNPPYGFTGVSMQHFVMEITGYYFAPQTGVYTISNQADEMDAIFIGNGGAFDCCAQNQDFSSSNLIISNLYGAGSLSNDVYLEANFYYPFKIVLVNMQGQGLLKVSIDLPDGSEDNTVGNNLYTYPDAAPDTCAVISKSHQFNSSVAASITTVTKTVTINGVPETVVVSPVTTTGKDGKPTTGLTTSVVGPVPPYTTTITTDGATDIAVVSPFTTTGKDGKSTTGLTTSV